MNQNLELVKELELPIIRSTALIMLIASTLSIFFNEALGLDKRLVILCIAGVVIFSLIYYFSYKTRFFQIVKSSVLIVTLVYLDAGWLLNYGLTSAIIAYFAIWALFATILLTRKEMFIWLGIFVVNLTILVWIELKNPDLVGDYPTKEAAIWDAFYTLIIAVLLLAVIIRHARRKYKNQYLRAKHADELKTAFLANFSHEIRTPLNSILGFSELLLDPEERDQLEERLKIISSNSEYLMKLIEDILDLSRIETDQLIIQPTQIDLSTLIIELCDEYQLRLKVADNKDVSLNCSIPKTPVTIITDKKRILQVLRNLLENAIKFTRQGSIDVILTESDRGVTVSVKDTGIGIDKNHLKTIFKRFVKTGHDLSHNQRCVGLGLALAKHLVKKLNGRISVVSSLGEGSTFSIILPKKI